MFRFVEAEEPDPGGSRREFKVLSCEQHGLRNPSQVPMLSLSSLATYPDIAVRRV